jgi:antitoxin CptB
MQTGLEMTDELETRRRRAYYRAHHRGTKELDFLVGRFADARLPAYSADELALFERFLAIPDPTVQEWILSGRAFKGVEFGDLIADIRSFHGLATETD